MEWHLILRCVFSFLISHILPVCWLSWSPGIELYIQNKSGYPVTIHIIGYGYLDGLKYNRSRSNFNVLCNEASPPSFKPPHVPLTLQLDHWPWSSIVQPVIVIGPMLIKAQSCLQGVSTHTTISLCDVVTQDFWLSARYYNHTALWIKHTHMDIYIYYGTTLGRYSTSKCVEIVCTYTSWKISNSNTKQQFLSHKFPYKPHEIPSSNSLYH